MRENPQNGRHERNGPTLTYSVRLATGQKRMTERMIVMKTYFEYAIAKDTTVRTIYAKDATSAMWAIIERHGVDVKVRWMERRQEKEIG
jgi:hypothetical protein